MQKTKTLSQLKRTISQSQGEHGTTGYRPKGGDEQNFFDQHKIEVIDDAAGNGDEVFKGTGVKVIDRKAEKHGYSHEEGKKVYDLRKNAEVAVKEETELQEGEESHAQFQKYHADAAKLLKNIHGGLSKHFDHVTNKKGYNNGQANWGHVGDIKHIHRQLQDIHDSILQQGEWAKPTEAKLAKEEVEQIEELSKDTLKSYSGKVIDKTRTMPQGEKKQKHLTGLFKAMDKMQEEVEEDYDTSLLEFWASLDQEDRNQLSEMLEKGLEQEILEFISEVDNG